jgi:tetratricopeptide (TPR) repeat protein
MTSGRAEQGVRELEEAQAKAPEDLQVAFALAGGYLRLGKVEDADRMFSRIIEARPIPQTHVLIGRVYQDFEKPERAEAEFRAALELDAGVRRAHYYLGLLLLTKGERSQFEAAAAEFAAEVEIAPDDLLANLELGSVLVEMRRAEEALEPLERVARDGPAQARTFYYLGRAQLAQGRFPEAVESLRRALTLAEEQSAKAEAVRLIQNQLGRALQRAGKREEAAVHFAEAQRLSAERSAADRERLERYLANEPEEPEAAGTTPVPVIEASPLAELSPSERKEINRRVRSILARTYFNLGVMQTQAKRFARAADMFENTADVDPDFPQVQSSLGVALFNARQFEEATGPLGRAFAASSGDVALGRLLAMAWLNIQDYPKAAELLRDDPGRSTDPSLQFAYGLALVRSDRAAEAEPVFASLLARHGDSAELSVLMGQASAQQGDFAAAVESLQRALRLKPDVAEAHAALGVIYLKQGRMEEAERALRAELAVRPDDLQSRQNLAVVLEAEQRPEEAVELLRGLLEVRPGFADARYLLGKILLAQGAVAEAVEHLEAAVLVAPEDANIHYQLGRAYQKQGHAERARAAFEVFRQLKAQR